jgi:hypothetical protein
LFKNSHDTQLVPAEYHEKKKKKEDKDGHFEKMKCPPHIGISFFKSPTAIKAHITPWKVP